jgi:predicted transcriptional regulator
LDKGGYFLSKPKKQGHRWSFLTNHSHVLLCLAKDSTMRIRDIGEAVGITQRAVQKIINDLESEGYIKRKRQGRRNCYKINASLPLRHPVEEHRDIADLIKLICGDDSGE